MRHFLAFPAVALSALVAVLGVAAPAAHAQTFSNAAPIAIPTGGTANPYPSSIVVSGVPASIGFLRVTLNGFSHTWVSDVNVLLVSPSGQKILLMANTNNNADATNNTLTFVPDGSATLPNSDTNVVSGVYACSVYLAPSALPVPAPAGPYGTSLTPLIGTSPNGTWNLYVWDDDGTGDSGTIAGGWSIGLSGTPPGPVATAFTYQGLLSTSGTPINGDANVRFTLCNSPTGATSSSAVAAPITRSFTGIQDGLITTALDFGGIIDLNLALWVNIEVESPPASGFVTLSPRQPITPTPQARMAQRAARAITADSATTATTAPWSGLTGQAAVSTDAIGSGWQMLFTNTTVGNFRGGMRLADNGFFEVTNNSNIASPNFARLAGNGTWTAVSDARLKDDITSAENNLAAAMKLRPVNFRWKGDGVEDFGLIAQEVREVLPRLVTGDETNDTLTLNYSQLSVVAIGAIQELKADNDRKQREIDTLRARLERLEEALGTEPAIRKP